VTIGWASLEAVLGAQGFGLLAMADGQVGFSWEAPGWQVMVEGMPEADAEGIVTEIAAQIGAATGQPTTWLAL
jgi:hypothetical protein